MERVSDSDELVSEGSDEGAAAPVDPEQIQRLSMMYGAELYTMIDADKQGEIAKRNSEMRVLPSDTPQAKMKSLRGPKDPKKTQADKPGSYINITSKDDKSKSKVKLKGTGGHISDVKSLRNVLDLFKLHNMLKNSRIPFTVMLDIELSRMLEWLTPTAEEKIAKEQALLQLEVVVNALFPDGKLMAFGSCRPSTRSDVTGLSLPGAGVDVSIQADGDQMCVLNLAVYALNRLGLVHSFECAYNAAVPVVKLVDKRTGVRVDLAAYNEDAFASTKFLQDKVCPAHSQCLKYKYLQPLVLLVKLYLQSRNLGDAAFGGVGSYLLTCMVLSFLQLHESSANKHADDSNSLATLFVDFFYYWGYIRDYNHVRGFGHVYPRKLRREDGEHLLRFDNPTDAADDIGAASYNMHSVTAAFQNAFMVGIAHAQVLRNIEANTPKWFPSHEVSFEMNFSAILESLYDVTHPVFQHRANKRAGNARRGYMAEGSKTVDSSLRRVLEHLRAELLIGKTETFNAQRELMEAASVGPDELEPGAEVPFYVLAEAVGKSGA